MEYKICKVVGCNIKINRSSAKQFCTTHYQRFRKYGDPLITHLEMHGKRYTSEYKTWQMMKQRCYLKTHISYPYYGGRGISVCNEWKNSFTSFYEDMGDKPFPKAQIDRINNDGNYEPENCRWVSCTVNIRNASRTKLTLKKAIQIRKLYAKGNITHKALGLLYNVSRATITNIINYKIWKENAI